MEEAVGEAARCFAQFILKLVYSGLSADDVRRMASAGSYTAARLLASAHGDEVGERLAAYIGGGVELLRLVAPKYLESFLSQINVEGALQAMRHDAREAVESNLEARRWLCRDVELLREFLAGRLDASLVLDGGESGVGVFYEWYVKVTGMEDKCV